MRVVRRLKQSLFPDEVEALEMLAAKDFKDFVRGTWFTYWKQFARRGLVYIAYGRGAAAYSAWVYATSDGKRLLLEHRAKLAAAAERKRISAEQRREARRANANG